MNRHARTFARCEESGDDRCVVEEDFGVRVRRDSAHRIMSGRHNRNRFGDRVDAQVGASKLGDVRKFRLENFGPEVGAIEQNVIFVWPGPAALSDFLDHATRDYVARREVFDRRGVALHEAFTARVSQNCSLAAGALSQEDS